MMETMTPMILITTISITGTISITTMTMAITTETIRWSSGAKRQS